MTPHEVMVVIGHYDGVWLSSLEDVSWIVAQRVAVAALRRSPLPLVN
jgi:hypothetical protein